MARVRIVLDKKVVRNHLLKNDEIMKKIKSEIGDKIANTVEDKSGDRGYTYEANIEEWSQRKAVIVSSPTPRARYSEAKHGWLQEEAHKNRGEL